MASKEIWKDIAGFDGRYRVSSRGRVYSIPRKVRQCDGKTISIKGRFFKKKRKKKKNSTIRYPSVTLSKNGTQRSWPIHKIVAQTFIGERPEGYHILPQQR